MAQSQIRGSTQILDGTIPAAKLAAGLNLPTSQLADAARFIFKDGTVAFTANQSMGGFNLTNLASPSAATDAATKGYVDALKAGIQIRFARVVAVANVSALNSTTTAIDGLTLTTGDIVLLTAQTTASQNGPWAASTTGSWTRPTNWAAAAIEPEGNYFIIDADGTTYKNTKWFVTNTTSITVDTTAVTFAQDQSGTAYSNGNGLSLTGTVFAVKTGNGVTFDGSQNVTLVLNGASLNLTASGVKITPGTPGQVMMGTTTTGEATFTSISGDVTVSSIGVTTVSTSTTTGFVKYANSIYNETPTGTVNGVNTAFTLANTPATNSLELFLNGQLLEPGAGNDYTISGAAITALFAPLTGDKIRAYYLK